MEKYGYGKKINLAITEIINHAMRELHVLMIRTFLCMCLVMACGITTFLYYRKYSLLSISYNNVVSVILSQKKKEKQNVITHRQYQLQLKLIF